MTTGRNAPFGPAPSRTTPAQPERVEGHAPPSTRQHQPLSGESRNPERPQSHPSPGLRLSPENRCLSGKVLAGPLTDSELSGVGRLTGAKRKNLPFWKRPIADIGKMADYQDMQCFFVLVEGHIDWAEDAGPPVGQPSERPAGFYCHRYVFPSSAKDAETRAMQRVRENFEREWTTRGASVELRVEKVSAAPLFKGFLPDNRGHTFYAPD